MLMCETRLNKRKKLIPWRLCCIVKIKSINGFKSLHYGKALLVHSSNIMSV